jgi:hypothetical protein
MLLARMPVTVVIVLESNWNVWKLSWAAAGVAIRPVLGTASSATNEAFAVRRDAERCCDLDVLPISSAPR